MPPKISIANRPSMRLVQEGILGLIAGRHGKVSVLIARRGLAYMLGSCKIGMALFAWIMPLQSDRSDFCSVRRRITMENCHE